MGRGYEDGLIGCRCAAGRSLEGSTLTGWHGISQARGYLSGRQAVHRVTRPVGSLESHEGIQGRPVYLPSRSSLTGSGDAPPGAGSTIAQTTERLVSISTASAHSCRSNQ